MKKRIWNIFTTELNSETEIEQALLTYFEFLVNILLVFSFSFCINILSVRATSMPSMKNA